MMISPKAYIMQFKDSDYNDLIRERDRLIQSIRHFEKVEKTGDRDIREGMSCPSPDVIYQMNLEYLSELCKAMKEKYNEEYVWGDKKLSNLR